LVAAAAPKRAGHNDTRTDGQTDRADTDSRQSEREISGEAFTKLKQSFKPRFNICVKKSRMK
jgi:hypothetical protein